MSILRLYGLRLALLCAAAGPAGAATFTVTKTPNTTDGVCDADCSLSEAIVAANANPGADTVAFAIPGGGVKTIATGTTGFPSITDTLTIDGYTQPESATNTETGASNNAVIRIELDGSLMTSTVLEAAAPNSVIRGIAVRGQTLARTGVTFLAGSDGSALRGCFIGTNAAGTADLSNGNGIVVRGANITIGGTAVANRNVISGNTAGIFVFDALAPGPQIQGNLIGVGANGLALGNSVGVLVTATGASTVGATIGGTATAARNFIANNTGDGIGVGSTVRGVRILGNLIYDNGDRGIDLGEDGTTFNDIGDLDTGANALQNFPVLQNAAATDEANTVLGFDVVRATGFLESTPSTSFRIELFEGGSGQDAESLLDTQNVTTDARGFATIRFESKGPVAPGRVLIATATNNATNDTSELSAIALVRTGFEVNTIEDTDDGNCTTDCSLREAINAANALFGVESIVFALDGALPHTIMPLTELPTLTQPVQIDGYSQPGTRYNSAPTGSNAIIGVEISGEALDSGSVGLRFGDNSGNSSVRGLAITGHEAGMGGGGAGISFDGSFNISGIRISGDFLGPDASGLTAPKQGAGLVMPVEPGGFIIGDSSPASPTQRNLISGNTGNGLLVRGGFATSEIRGNGIGVAANGSPLGNGGNGILATDGFLLPIGGSAARDANEIAYNGAAGVRLEANGDLSSMLGNLFHDNVGLGIDLGATEGVTPNDENDLDTGPNGLQNFPVSNLAVAGNGLTTVGGTLNSTPNRNFRIEYYASPDCHPSGNGEGRQFLGFLNAATAADGNATLSGQIPVLPLAGYDQLTATATELVNFATSEFSACLPLPYSDPLFASSFE